MSVMCREVVENIIGYIESELDGETLRDLEAHLHECPECLEFVNTYKKMLEMAGKLRERSFVSPEVREKLKKVLQSKLKSSSHLET
ncbi:MAG: zf-HC2 domain-containing protein [Candidatus Dadabacteria bacterium]|nr:zf-HC2 domain-containing protein [Candidatus Dadabacteria bacterium]